MFLTSQSLLHLSIVIVPLIIVAYVIYRVYICYRVRSNLFRRMLDFADNVHSPNHLPALIELPGSTLSKLTLTQLEQHLIKPNANTNTNTGGNGGNGLPDTYDCIVIGSGVSGLTSASILSFEGLSVLVLEQHPETLGGGSHVFQKEGLEFNTGLHYLGRGLYDERTSEKGDFIPMGIAAVTGRDWDLRVIKNDIKAHRFGHPPMNEMETPEMESKRVVRLSPRAYTQDLAKNFPEQAEKIAEFERISKLAEKTFVKVFLHMMLPKWIIAILRLVGYFRDLEEFAKVTVNDLLDHCQIVDPKVRAVLQQVGSYGLNPAEAWMPLHGVVGMSMGYKSYPYGGFGTFADVMCEQITKRGGMCACNALVEEIMVDGKNRATGVRLKGGRKFFARKSIVSTAGIQNTLMRMVPEYVRKEKLYEERIMSNVEHGKSYFVCYMGFDCETEALGFHCNTTVYSKEACSLDRHEQDTGILQLSPENGFEGFEKVGRISLDAQCVCDPSWKERFPGKSAIIVVSIFNYDWVKPWESLTKAQRASCSEYQNVKNSFMDQICKMMFAHYPTMEEHTIFCDAGTPLTAMYYNLWDKGQMYGLKATFERMMMRDQVNIADIDGLVLGGQDVCLMGINGAFVSGLMASGAVLKSNLVLAAMAETKRRWAEQQELQEEKAVKT